MQLTMNVATKEQVRKSWAFAAYKRRPGRLGLKQLNQAIITSCSKEAKILGIQAGMRYEDAKQLLPDLRVLVYGGGRHGRQRA